MGCTPSKKDIAAAGSLEDVNHANAGANGNAKNTAVKDTAETKTLLKQENSNQDTAIPRNTEDAKTINDARPDQNSTAASESTEEAMDTVVAQSSSEVSSAPVKLDRKDTEENIVPTTVHDASIQPLKVEEKPEKVEEESGKVEAESEKVEAESEKVEAESEKVEAESEKVVWQAQGAEKADVSNDEVNEADRADREEEEGVTNKELIKSDNHTTQHNIPPTQPLTQELLLQKQLTQEQLTQEQLTQEQLTQEQLTQEQLAQELVQELVEDTSDEMLRTRGKCAACFLLSICTTRHCTTQHCTT